VTLPATLSMADSSSDPPSDDPLGSFADEAELVEFVEATLRRLGRGGLPADGTLPGALGGAEESGSGWRVDARGDGTYAVISEQDDEVAGTFRDRRQAYLVAATLTAAGPLQDRQESRPPKPAADAVAEAAEGLDPAWTADPVERRKELTARTLRSLLANPRAIELFLESIDPEVLREAMEIREAEREDSSDETN